MDDTILRHLVELGFNGVEAAAYVALLKEPGASGYRISRLIGKPVPNTYKALDSLKEKGAVVMDDSSGTRSYVALSIHEYLDGVRRNLTTKQEQVEAELKNLTAAPMESGIYQLTSAEQVYERCRNMLEQAKSVVLLDAFQKPLEVLRPHVLAAVRRGVRILVLAYGPTDIEGCEVIAPRKEVPDVAKWDGDWLNMCVDCSEFVYSLIKKDGMGVHRAVWSRDVYLALMAFSGILNELVLRRVFQMLHRGQNKDEIHDEVRRMSQRYVSESPFDRVISQWRREVEPKPEPKDEAGRRSRQETRTFKAEQKTKESK